MGITNVNLKVSNLKDESRFVEDEFLVDSGAMAQKIGIKSTGEKRRFSLADGTLEAIGLVLDPFKRQLFEAKLFL
jgi:hypothetical protein